MEAVPHLAERLLVWFEISNSQNGLQNLTLITFSCFDLEFGCNLGARWVQDGCKIGCKILGANCLIMSTGCKKCKIFRVFIYIVNINKF